MVVDIGGGTTEIAVMSLGALVVNKSIPIAGDALNQDIVQYMHTAHSMRIGEPTAKRTTIDFHVAEDPLHSVAKGTGIALKNLHTFSFLIDGKL